MPAWCLIEARADVTDKLRAAGFTEKTRVAGLSLIARHGRAAARAGFDGMVVRAPDEATRDRLQAALATQPPPPSFAVEYAVGDAPPADRDYVELSLHAVYERDSLAAAQAGEGTPVMMAAVESRADVRDAEARLFRSIRKSIDQDGVLAYYTQRPIARPLTRLVIDTPISPNHISLLAMSAGLTAAICAAVSGAAPVAVAGFLYWLGAVIDCIDGDLARLRFQGSKLGEWLDTLADDVSTYALLAGLGIGLLRDGHDQIWAIVGVGGAILGALIQAKLYADLHRMGKTIDSAQYPWFFGTPSEGGQSSGGLGATLLYWFSFLFRRDTYVTAIGILLILGQRYAAVAILAAGVAIIAGLFVVHHLVMALRQN